MAVEMNGHRENSHKEHKEHREGDGGNGLYGLYALYGSSYLLPVIVKAHALGLYVITCDYLPHNARRNGNGRPRGFLTRAG